jgi:hypothetical protein
MLSNLWARSIPPVFISLVTIPSCQLNAIKLRIPPFEKGGVRGDFKLLISQKIPLSPPLSKGEVKSLT